MLGLIPYSYPVDISGTVVGKSQDCLLLSQTVVGENPDHVCWAVCSETTPYHNILQKISFLLCQIYIFTERCCGRELMAFIFWRPHLTSMPQYIIQKCTQN